MSHSQQLPQPLIILTVALGGILFGYDSGLIAGALIYIPNSFPVSTFEKEWMTSSLVIGALLGAISSGKLSLYWGRRRLLRLAASGFIIGALLTTLATSTTMLSLGRSIIGLSIGISAYAVPLYLAESAPQIQRGRIILLNGIMITGGQVLAYLIDYHFSHSGLWRWMFASSLIPAIIFWLGLRYIPESPVWQSQLQTRNPKKTDYRWADIFQRPMQKPLFIGIALGALQQFSGINTVLYYGPFWFQATGMHNHQSEIFATCLMGVTNLAATLLLFFLVDRIGRRPLLITGSLLAATSLIAMSVLLPQLPSNWQAFTTISLLILYISGYAISLGSLFWLIIAEIYPAHLRGPAMGFVSAMQWLANFFVSISFLTILQSVGASNSFLIYGVICLIAFFIAWQFVPETKNYQVGVEG
jgi:MFS family permease